MKDRNFSRIVEHEVFNYARENLAVINIFIKARFDIRNWALKSVKEKECYCSIALNYSSCLIGAVHEALPQD